MKKNDVSIISLLILVGCLGWSVTIAAAIYDPIVEQAQTRLTELGYKPGPIDGFWGKKTETAIRNFQKDQNLPLTGKLDEETIRKLGFSMTEEQPKTAEESGKIEKPDAAIEELKEVVEPVPGQTSSEDIIKRAQHRLLELGYHLEALNGEMDKKTITAIREFQQFHELPATGQLDEKTIRKLDLRSQAEIQAAFMAKYGVTFSYPTALYLDITPTTGKYDEPVLAERIKFFAEPAQNRFSISDLSQEFKTSEELNTYSENITQIFVEEEFTPSWEKIGPFNAFVLRKQATNRYLTIYLIATGEHGFAIELGSPEEHGLTLAVENNDTLVIQDHVDRPHASAADRQTSAFCDICSKKMTGGGYILHTDDVLESESYIDWYISYHKQRGTLPKTLEDTPEFREEIRTHMRQTSGRTPWLVCDTCMHRIFPHILKDKECAQFYRKQAEIFWDSGGRVEHLKCRDLSETPLILSNDTSASSTELSSEQFWEAFNAALLKQDTEQISRLLMKNPTAVKEIYRQLIQAGEGAGEEAEQARAIAEYLRTFLSDEAIQAAQEIPTDQFLEELLVAFVADDTERIQQLVTDNPYTAREVYQQAMSLGESSTGEEAEGLQAVAELINPFLSGNVVAGTEEISSEPFLKEFQSVLHNRDAAACIRQLVTDNPDTARQVYNQLMQSGQSTGKDAQKSRRLAQILKKFLSEMPEK